MTRAHCTFVYVGLVTLYFVATNGVYAAVDDFNGTAPPSLFGESTGAASGGIAWTGTWGDQGFGSSPNIVTGSGDLGTINGFSSTDPYVEYPLDNSQGGVNAPEGTRGFSSQSNQSAVYVYGLVAVGNPIANSFGGIGLFDGAEKFLIGKRFGSNNWGVATSNLNGAAQDSGVAINTFDTALLAAKIDQVNNDLTFWVNPDFSLTEGANTPEFTFNYGGNNDNIDNVRLRAGDPNSGEVWQWDNINITGQSPFTLEQSIVPEPSTFLLAGFGTLLLLFRRRFRRPRVSTA